MEGHVAIAEFWDELPRHEETDGKDAEEMDGNAPAVPAATIVVPVTRGDAAGKGTVEVEVLETGKSKEEHACGEDEDCET